MKKFAYAYVRREHEIGEVLAEFVYVNSCLKTPARVTRFVEIHYLVMDHALVRVVAEVDQEFHRVLHGIRELGIRSHISEEEQVSDLGTIATCKCPTLAGGRAPSTEELSLYHVAHETMRREGLVGDRNKLTFRGQAALVFDQINWVCGTHGRFYTCYAKGTADMFSEEEGIFSDWNRIFSKHHTMKNITQRDGAISFFRRHIEKRVVTLLKRRDLSIPDCGEYIVGKVLTPCASPPDGTLDQRKSYVDRDTLHTLWRSQPRDRTWSTEPSPFIVRTLKAGDPWNWPRQPRRPTYAIVI